MSTKARTYREFWPQYVAAHRRLITQRTHLASTLIGTACAVAGIASGQWVWLALSPVVAFAIAVSSHVLFEGNKPTMGQHPLWSVCADLHMCGLLMAGRMGKEAARLAATKTGVSLPPDLESLGVLVKRPG
jgi:hypothetical protein